MTFTTSAYDVNCLIEHCLADAPEDRKKAIQEAFSSAKASGKKDGTIDFNLDLLREMIGYNQQIPGQCTRNYTRVCEDVVTSIRVS
jgi:hypothetical protein